MATTQSGKNDYSNVEAWSGFFATEEEATKHLAIQTASIARYKKIVSSKKTLIEQKRHVNCHGLLLFKFIVITSNL
jgi:hypothetical protein